MILLICGDWIWCQETLTTQSRLGRNAAFEKAGHTRLVAPKNEPVAEEGSIDLLVQLLLPLCGNEEFDIDVSSRLRVPFPRDRLPLLTAV